MRLLFDGCTLLRASGQRDPSNWCVSKNLKINFAVWVCCKLDYADSPCIGYIQLLKAMTGSFDSEFEPILVQIDRSSDEVSETIRLVEATLSTGERHDQRAERQEAQNHRLETIIHRKERMKVEADRMAHKQLERQSEFHSVELISFACHGLTRLERYRNPSSIQA